jgi:hypothetical protein
VPDFLRRLLDWFRARPPNQRALIASAVIIFLVLISRVLFVIAGIVFLATLCGMIVQLVRQESARSWVAATGIALVMTLLFGLVANTLYPIIKGQVRAGMLLTAVIALAGIATGVAAIRQARAAENLASMTARSLRVTEQSLRAQHERARLDLEMDVLFRLDERFFYGPRFREARREAIEHIKVTYIDKDLLADDDDLPKLRDCTSAAQDVLNFFEAMSHLIRREVLHPETVWNKFGWWIEGYWALYEPWIKEKRKEWPNLYSDFEILKSHMVRLDFELENPKAEEFANADNLRRFVRYEVADTQ